MRITNLGKSVVFISEDGVQFNPLPAYVSLHTASKKVTLEVDRQTARLETAEEPEEVTPSGQSN